MKELKKIAAEANTFRDLLAIQNTGNIHNASNSSRFVTSSLLTDKVFGCDGDRDKIINFLFDNRGCSSLRKSYSIVAVTGLGGAGKTTHAQYVYNDPRVKQYFPMKMWLCLSQKLDITKHTKEMIECASKKECPNLKFFDFLQNKLLDSLPESNSILVVLDDVWYDHNDGPEGEKQWENFFKPLASRGGTCKIVITSRSTVFPIALRPKKLDQLHDLTRNDFIPLLRYQTIDDLQINNPQLRNDLSHIVDQIAKKMSISPLAATVVGNQLHERPNIRLWLVTLENVNLSDTMMKSLLWSFHHLDVQLQWCFLFCSIFPKGTRYDLDIMVSYWVALDFIQPSNYNTSVEDIGLEYFEKMVANSIFHKVDKNKYIMHDLFHDLAEKLTAEDCLRVTNAEREIPLTVQHVYLEAFNNEDLKENLSSICKLGNLRTLILVNPLCNDISEIISKISTNFRNLRVLDVRSRGYKIPPRVVGDFRNLRLLSFWQSSIKQLPNSVLQLYHLQYLRLPSSEKTLPTELSNNEGRSDNTLPPVTYLGKLTSLKCLDEFHVRKKEGYKLRQLGSLKEIGGSLRILNLENVKYKDEAVEARLLDKSNLKSLELVWNESSKTNDLELEIEIIEALRAPKNLEYLTVVGYRGSTYPTWTKKVPL